MRSLRHGITAFAVILLLGVAVQAEDAAKAATADTEKQLKNQTHCPVMGGKIDSSSYTDIQGQRVYHCCPGCTDALRKDPDKFFKQAAADGILFENIQTTCPVSGKELADKSIFVDYEGRRIAFCCENCPPKFKEDPQAFLKKLDAASGDKDAKKHDHDHDHGAHGDHKH